VSESESPWLIVTDGVHFTLIVPSSHGLSTIACSSVIDTFIMQTRSIPWLLPVSYQFFLNFTYRLDIRLSRFCIFTPLLQSALLSSYLNYCHHFESYDLPSLRHLHLRIYFYAHLTHHLLRLPL